MRNPRCNGRNLASIIRNLKIPDAPTSTKWESFTLTYKEFQHFMDQLPDGAWRDECDVCINGIPEDDYPAENTPDPIDVVTITYGLLYPTEQIETPKNIITEIKKWQKENGRNVKLKQLIKLTQELLLTNPDFPQKAEIENLLKYFKK